ncbi:hypothetical protein [Xanthobacter sediminis]
MVSGHRRPPRSAAWIFLARPPWGARIEERSSLVRSCARLRRPGVADDRPAELFAMGDKVFVSTEPDEIGTARWCVVRLILLSPLAK